MAGSGFLSQRLGKGIGEAGLGPSGCIGTNRFKMDEKGNLAPVWTGSRCTFLGKAVTPGKILGETAANTLDTKLKRVGGATFLTDIILSLFAAVVDGTTSRLANFAGQYTFDGPPSVPEAVPRVGSFDEKRFEPGADDPNFDPEIKRAREAGEAECKNSCIQREQEGCATTIDPVTGEETRDQACMEAAESVCNSKCSQITAPVNPYD